MIATLAAWIAATPVPTPLPTVPDDDLVTPGPWGFLAFLLVALLVVVLAWDMVRRVRRTSYRGEIVERLESERAELERQGLLTPEQIDAADAQAAAEAAAAIDGAEAPGGSEDTEGGDAGEDPRGPASR